jgi:hypothetical protein
MAHPKNRVTIKKDRDWGEYIVRTYRGGKLVGTYHTDDKKDAQDTANFIRKDEHSKGFMNNPCHGRKRKGRNGSYRRLKLTKADRKKYGRRRVSKRKVGRFTVYTMRRKKRRYVRRGQRVVAKFSTYKKIKRGRKLLTWRQASRKYGVRGAGTYRYKYGIKEGSGKRKGK